MAKQDWKDKLAKKRKSTRLDVVVQPSTFLGNTGLGQDGVLQPSNPTNMMMTPEGMRMVHEGENLVQNPDGSITIFPAAQSQEQLKQMEQQGVPGFQTGATVQPDLKKTQTGIGGATVGSEKEQPGLGGTQIAPFTPDPVVQQTTAPAPGQFNLPTTTPPPQQQPVLDAPATQPTTTPAPATFNLPGEQPVTQTPPTTAPSPFETGTQQAFQQVQQQAAGDSPVDRAIASSALGGLGAEQEARRTRTAQDLAQTGVTGGQLQSALAQGARQSGIEQATVRGQLAIGAQERAAQAARDVFGMGIQGQEFELRRREFENTEQWNNFLRAAEFGDDAAVSAAYQEVFGKPITDAAQINQIRDYSSRVRQLELEGAELGIDAQTIANESARLGLTSQQYSQARDLIGQGFDVSQVNEATGFNLTPDQFNSIFATTAAGERDFARQMDFAGTLLEAGGETNVTQAAEIFNTQFPGSNIDFGRVITAQNTQDWGNGMGQIADLIASNVDIEEGLNSLETTGLLEAMGISREEAETLWNSMNTNAIDQQWQTISDSQWYQGLTTEDQDLIGEIFDATQSGSLDFAIVQDYNVLDAEGNVARTFSSFNEAQEWAEANDGTVEEGDRRIAFKNPLTNEVFDGGGGTPTAGSTSEAYNAYLDTVPQGEVPLSFNDWESFGNPDSFEAAKDDEGIPVADHNGSVFSNQLRTVQAAFQNERGEWVTPSNGDVISFDTQMQTENMTGGANSTPVSVPAGTYEVIVSDENRGSIPNPIYLFNTTTGDVYYWGSPHSEHGVLFNSGPMTVDRAVGANSWGTAISDIGTEVLGGLVDQYGIELPPDTQDIFDRMKEQGV